MTNSTDSFFNKITNALKTEMPFAAYRYPKADEIKGVFQKDVKVYTTKIDTESGFVFAPFDDANQTIIFPQQESEIITTSSLEETVIDTTTKINPSPATKTIENTHVDLVKKGVDFLKATSVKKVVLSRKEKLYYSNFDIVNTFKKLLLRYSNAMVYLWFHPSVGLWLGATPETLVKVQGEVFTTMALAGTQMYRKSLDVVWQEKEKQEQQFVTDYIVKKLHNVSVSKPITIKAGSLLHLCTSISGNLSNDLTLHRLIKLLHPTPAVCGLPKDEAKIFILEHEGYHREFYTGFLGEMNMNKTSHLFVNLRCMQVQSDHLAIYIGGGITADSIPEKEWEETVNKSEIIKKVLY